MTLLEGFGLQWSHDIATRCSQNYQSGSGKKKWLQSCGIVQFWRLFGFYDSKKLKNFQGEGNASIKDV